jgi:phosphatidylglycerophosphatase A
MSQRKTTAKIIATGLGSGLAPKAPGTVGSVAALVIIYAMAYMGARVSATLLVAMSAVAYLVGHWSCAVLADEWGHDPGKIVIDEWVGMWLSLVLVPFQWQTAVVAFVAFRFFDIIKPLGVGYIDQHMGGPTSVMLDDVLAGVYAAVVTYAVHMFIFA